MVTFLRRTIVVVAVSARLCEVGKPAISAPLTKSLTGDIFTADSSRLCFQNCNLHLAQHVVYTVVVGVELAGPRAAVYPCLFSGCAESVAN